MLNVEGQEIERSIIKERKASLTYFHSSMLCVGVTLIY